MNKIQEYHKMKNLSLNINQVYPFVTEEEINSYENQIKSHISALHNKTGPGGNFLGWLDLPSAFSISELSKIKQFSVKLQQEIDVLVVIGIGGSYLGARAVIEALSHSFTHLRKNHHKPLVLYAGHNLSEDYLTDLLEIIDEKSYGIIVISKSGTTTEPAVAFRILKNHLENKIGKVKARGRIVAITDFRHGTLRNLAEYEGYITFSIPVDVGGRYSILTPAGILPIAIAGFDIDQLIKGANVMQFLTDENAIFRENPASLYAAIRNVLYKKGKTIEILVNYSPKLHYFSEWWKQLYGESEGKENKGIFPASVDFTTDLHSMGQYIQEGKRNIFETIISISSPEHKLRIPTCKKNLDKLNYLSGRPINEINKMAELGTKIAHVDGGIPNISIEIPKLSEFYLGQLIYFFEKACAISGYILGINPFNQPGVEAYKNNMFTLLEKPGYEKQANKIRARALDDEVNDKLMTIE
jgi:glucose-6-phosphate isomerase